MRPGQWVEVRSASEISATLDAASEVDGLPFMPEMLAYCGRRFRVLAAAHKTCDTISNSGGRRMHGAVHLEELRCDGAAHGGCEARCLLFWKREWVREVDGPGAEVDKSVTVMSPSTNQLAESLNRVSRGASGSTGRDTYRCQATQLLAATAALPWWDIRQYWQDVRCGNVSAGRAVTVLTLSWFRAACGVGVGYRLAWWLYDRVHRLLTGRPGPRSAGSVPDGQPTPAVSLGLRPGETVRVRSLQDIQASLNSSNKNRGLWFDNEMVQHCGRLFKVERRVSRIIEEKTGEMIEMKQPCIVLRGNYCTGSYTEQRLLCPRRVVTYWREAWLERAPARDPERQS